MNSIDRETTESDLQTVRTIGGLCLLAVSTVLILHVVGSQFFGLDLHAVEGSFFGGFLHPLLGYDHLAAMVSVGMISLLIGGDAVVRVPAVFVSCLLVGGVIGMAGYAVTEVEMLIALSICALGILILLQIKPNIVVVGAVIALFGIVHGNAHGLELPGGASGAWYAIGFCSASAACHLAGISIGDALNHARAPRASIALSGALLLTFGVWLIAGV